MAVLTLALAIVLLVGAGLLIRSFVNLLDVNPGFTADNLLTARLSLPYPRYQDRVKREQFPQQVMHRLSTLPGVESAGAINPLPLTEFVFAGWLRVQGQRDAINRNEAGIPIGQVTPDYFRTMGIPLRAGRTFTERDNAAAPRVVILNEALARKLFPGEDPIGKRVWVPGPGKEMPTVVGVVGDVRHQVGDGESMPRAVASAAHAAVSPIQRLLLIAIRYLQNIAPVDLRSETDREPDENDDEERGERAIDEIKFPLPVSSLPTHWPSGDKCADRKEQQDDRQQNIFQTTGMNAGPNERKEWLDSVGNNRIQEQKRHDGEQAHQCRCSRIGRDGF